MQAEPQTVAGMMQSSASLYPHGDAILAPGRPPLTFERLFAHIVETVQVLNGMGIGRKDRVAVVMPSSAVAAVALIAVEATAICVACNPGYSLAEFTALLSRLKVTAVIIAEGVDTAAWMAAAQMGLPVITLTPIPDGVSGLFRLSGDLKRKPIAPGSEAGGFTRTDDLAYLMFTSGTTAASKVVPITQRAGYEQILWSGGGIGLTPQDRLLSFMPMFHIAGLGSVQQALLYGGSALVLPGFEVKTFFQALADYRPTWFNAVTTLYQTILDQAPHYADALDKSSLRCIVAVSMAMDYKRSEQLEQVLKAPILQGYGSTEAGLVSRTPLPPLPRKLGSAGLPIKGLDVAMIDDDGRFLPHGATGEIVIRGPSIMKGYEDDPLGTADAFIGDWYRTGDLGYFDEDGYLYIVGRVKEVINRGGQKVSPGEVEDALLAHPQVAQAAAFALPDPRLGDEVAAAVVLRTPDTVTEALLRDFAATMLAPYKVPRRIVFVDDLPKTAIGKVQRLGLAQKLGLTIAPAPTISEFAPPRTKNERRLTKLWGDVLGYDPTQIGIHSRFAELGGTSLSAAHLIFKARETFDVQVTILDLFDAPTIAEQAVIIDRLQRSPISSAAGTYMIPIQSKGMRPPLYGFPAIEGGAFFYRQLIPYLSAGQPIYGLLAVGMDDGREPQRSVSDMAAHHFQQIKAVQLRGPYYLCGYSFGGRLALETARLLREDGHADAYVLMIDDLLQRSAVNHTVRTIGQRLETQRFAFTELTPLQRRLFVQQRLAHRLHRTAKHNELEYKTRDLPPTIERVRDAGIDAVNSYMPRPYDGQVCYLMALDNPISVPLIKTLKYIGSDKMTIRSIPGAHGTLFKPPYVEAVGREVQRWLDEMSSTTP